MLSVSECRERAGLGSHEVVLGVSPGSRHDNLLASYLLNLKKGERFVLEMIVADLRAFLDLGAPDYAADVFIVLRRFLDGRPNVALRASWREFARADEASRMFGACRIRPEAFPAFEAVVGDGRATN